MITVWVMAAVWATGAGVTALALVCDQNFATVTRKYWRLTVWLGVVALSVFWPVLWGLVVASHVKMLRARRRRWEG